MLGALKRLFVGRPLATTQMEEQRLPKTIALAVFSSDALSSTAYATEEILFVTALGASSLALGLSQARADRDRRVRAARDRDRVVPAGDLRLPQRRRRLRGEQGEHRRVRGPRRGRVADGRLRADGGGVDLGRRRRDHLDPDVLGPAPINGCPLGVALIVLITLANMRGVKESGRIFAIPTYVYMLILGALIVLGLSQAFFGDSSPVPFDPEAFDGTLESGGSLGIFLLLKGFSSGAVALTGVEAISNGVPAFRRPESKNAAATLVWMGVLLGSLFLGVSILAHHLKPYPSHDRTVMAQMGLAVFGDGPAFVILQFATAAILTLAANTAYNGFPSLSSIIAKDGYLPAPARAPRRPPGVLQRHHRAGRGRGRCCSLRSTASPTPSSRSTQWACSRRSRCRSGGWCATTGGCGSRGGSATSCSNTVGAVATLVGAADRRGHQVHRAARGSRSS